MEYKIKNGNITEYYEINFDENINNLIEELKKYSYERLSVTEFINDKLTNPSKESTIELVYNRFNRVNELINSTVKLIPDSIVFPEEDNNSKVTYVHSYKKLPNLYDFLIYCIITEDHNTSKDECIKGIFNYIDSEELSHIEPQVLTYYGKEYKTEVVDYDYIGLNKLYQEILKNIHVKLIAKKEIYDNNQEINAEEFIKRRKLDNN